MDADKKYMIRCIELAKKGAGYVSPNPMVGCIIVHKGKIIGKGYHKKYGDAHAEVNAINSVKNKDLLKDSTLYVTLEPCAHFGKTPPCSDLIVTEKVPDVVIGTKDSFAEVAGKGIEKMKKAGICVRVGILENECRELNKRFFTYHEKKRPYIILKWAQTKDGFIDVERDEARFGKPTWITGESALERVHKMRGIEDAILVGANTAFKDNPSLKVYRCKGRNPIRIIIDNKLRLPENLKLFDNSARTIVFNSVKSEIIKSTEYIRIDFSKEVIPQILEELYKLEIQSVIIEGGKQTLQSYIDSNYWDEAQIFTGNKLFKKGISAPVIKGRFIKEETLDSDILKILQNQPN